MSQQKKLLFPRVAEAMAAWTAIQPDLYDAMLASKTDADVAANVWREEWCAALVRNAFAEDTADRNSRENAFCVSVGPWLQRMAAEVADAA